MVRLKCRLHLFFFYKSWGIKYVSGVALNNEIRCFEHNFSLEFVCSIRIIIQTVYCVYTLLASNAFITKKCLNLLPAPPPLQHKPNFKLKFSYKTRIFSRYINFLVSNYRASNIILALATFRNYRPTIEYSIQYQKLHVFVTLTCSKLHTLPNYTKPFRSHNIYNFPL